MKINSYTKMDKTLVQLFYEAVNKYPDHVIYKYKDKKSIFHSITYRDFFDKIERFAAGLIELKLNGKKMAVISDNCIEWMMAVIANMSLGGIDVPRGINTSEKELKYILEHADVDFICIQNLDAYNRLDKAGFKKKTVRIIFDEDKIKLKSNDITFNDVCIKGEKFLKKDKNVFIDCLNKVKIDDPATIIYTSGTTGEPKGVVLSNKNLTYSPTIVPSLVTGNDDEVWMSILPVWHVGERFYEFMAIIHGITLVLSSMFALKDDMVREKPHVIAGVPLVWKKVMDAIIKGIEESGKGRVFHFFYNKSLKYKKALCILNNLNLRYKKNGILKKGKAFFSLLFNLPFHLFAQNVIYKKIIAKTGGNIRMVTSGGGKLQDEVDDFFDIIGINLIDGYGSTETAVIVTIRGDRHIKYTIGKITPNTQYKIINQETGRQCRIGETGTLFVKGDQVFKNYYNNEKATKEVFDIEGFYNTGDLVNETLTGDLVFIGRQKDTIVLLNGENVEPEPIELAIENNKFIKHAIVIGQDKEELSALIVPDYELLGDKAIDDNAKFLKNEIKKIINTKNGFRIHELIKNVIVLKDDFEQGRELTNTMKKKRNYILGKYKELITG
ncbi:MAG: AMP-binding protein [Spirochaetes bacterium]|nr:AMP-binding protein [Spirochaetota bacterium]